ncbi:MAG: glycosyltransferase [Lentimicrobiaceae bacterium]|jgi:glycosyltransferase involved in cell wall biosynthesis|nr:glycosyltransferase [Lentimicrobiaceae bacterium]
MISIVICTYNRDKYIYNVLKSIAEQEYPVELYEIVLINNNSTDNTEALCLKFRNDYPHVNFQYHIETQQGLSFARNRGIVESKGEIIIYIDDDAEAQAGFLNEYEHVFEEHPDMIAAGGKVIPVFEGKEPKWMSKIMRTLLGGALDHGNKIKPFKKGTYPGGGNAAYKKEAFEIFGLFNTDLGRKGGGLMGSEEKDMFDRFRKKELAFYYVPKAVIYHYIPESRFSETFFKKLSVSIGFSEKTRTLAVSKRKYIGRLFQEVLKWIFTMALLVGYTIILQPQKGWKLLRFRAYVTKGLLKKNEIN